MLAVLRLICRRTIATSIVKLGESSIPGTFLMIGATSRSRMMALNPTICCMLPAQYWLVSAFISSVSSLRLPAFQVVRLCLLILADIVPNNWDWTARCLIVLKSVHYWVSSIAGFMQSILLRTALTLTFISFGLLYEVTKLADGLNVNAGPRSVRRFRKRSEQLIHWPCQLQLKTELILFWPCTSGVKGKP